MDIRNQAVDIYVRNKIRSRVLKMEMEIFMSDAAKSVLYLRRYGGTMSHAYTVLGVNTRFVVTPIVAGRPTTIYMSVRHPSASNKSTILLSSWSHLL